ncbi:MAG: WxcM-like domain-containing protein [Chloroflexi bacterium]|nr:WxcM-like domain-containing protein [Chloroflexota bacterium]
MASTIEIVQASVFSVDERGWNIDPVDRQGFETTGIKNMHIVSVRPGAVRGNHVHHLQREHMCLLQGTVLLVHADASGVVGRRLIEVSRTPVIIKIPPRVAHAIKNVGDQLAFLVCYSDRDFDPDHRDSESTLLLDE